MRALQAVNKLAEILNRKELSRKPGKKVNASELRKKEKDCRKLQQELTQVGRGGARAGVDRGVHRGVHRRGDGEGTDRIYIFPS